MTLLPAHIRSWFGGNSPFPGETNPYKVYTRKFDRTVKASQLDIIIGNLPSRQRSAHDEAWEAFNGALEGWRTQFHLAALEASDRIRSALSDQARADVVVSILIDQSGSMRGQKMLLTAAASDVVQQFLSLLGCKVEVLGFTTSSWHGGFSRRRWRRHFRPRNPGRLCDLLHIVYRTADDQTAATAGWSFKPMLRPDLPKENVDGEAIEWAAARLRARPERRKLILVISDGVPADDATLLANGADFLTEHLRTVVDAIEESPDIEIAAVGLEPHVEDFYSTAVAIDTPKEIGGALISMIEHVLTARTAKDVDGPDKPGHDD